MEQHIIPLDRAYRSLPPRRRASVAVDLVGFAASAIWIAQSWHVYLNCLAFMLMALLACHAAVIFEANSWGSRQEETPASLKK